MNFLRVRTRVCNDYHAQHFGPNGRHTNILCTQWCSRLHSLTEGNILDSSHSANPEVKSVLQLDRSPSDTSLLQRRLNTIPGAILLSLLDPRAPSQAAFLPAPQGLLLYGSRFILLGCQPGQLCSQGATEQADIMNIQLTPLSTASEIHKLTQIPTQDQTLTNWTLIKGSHQLPKTCIFLGPAKRCTAFPTMSTLVNLKANKRSWTTPPTL